MLFPDASVAEFWAAVWGGFVQGAGVASGALFMFFVAGFVMWLVTRR
jgi:hypothetical protein